MELFGVIVTLILVLCGLVLFGAAIASLIVFVRWLVR